MYWRILTGISFVSQQISGPLFRVWEGNVVYAKKCALRPTRQEVEWNTARKRDFCRPLSLGRMQDAEGTAALRPHQHECIVAGWHTR